MALSVLLALCSACGESEVRELHVPKGSNPIVQEHATAAPAAGSAPATDQAPAATVVQDDPASPAAAARWVVPSGWREVHEPRPMRLTTFVIDDPAGPIEVAVTRFPGDTGGVLANVNRWRGQIGLAPASPADLEALLTPFASPGFEGYLLHLEGPAQHMVVASIHEQAENRTWFVRVVAEQAVAQRVEPEVFAFARSFGTAQPVSQQREQP